MTNKYKIIIFDIGGTLMEYTGMPLSWVDYYKQGFENINDKFSLQLSENDIQKSAEIMRELNPRINYRENELSPAFIFHSSTAHWASTPDICSIIEAFFDGLNLRAKIFDYSVPLIKRLKEANIIVGLLTDLPSGMPDYIFTKEIKELLNECDFYISSQSCGYRKPNPYAILEISKKYSIPLNQVLFIGDEEKDMLTAQNAKCDFMHIKNFKKKHYEN